MLQLLFEKECDMYGRFAQLDVAAKLMLAIKVKDFFLKYMLTSNSIFNIICFKLRGRGNTFLLVKAVYL